MANWPDKERRSNPPLGEWRPSPASAFEHVAQSLLEVSLITGFLLRLFRAAVLTHGAPDNFLYIGGSFAIGAVFLFSMLTVHLARVPLNQWVWRAPAFAALETAAEMLTSLALIWMSKEPWGSGSAGFIDWPSIAMQVLLSRLVVLGVYALLLGLIVQRVRRVALQKERKHSGILRSEIGRTVLDRSAS